MVLTKDQKKVTMQQYRECLERANNVVLLEQKKVWVNDTNELRKQMDNSGGMMQVIRKRLFLRVIDELNYKGCDIGKVGNSIVALYSFGDEEYASLKKVADSNKKFKKDKRKDTEFWYLWGFYDKVWKDGSHVAELASLPSKEELISKFLFLLKYPIQSFASVLDQIKDNIADDSEVVGKEDKNQSSSTEESVEDKDSEKEEKAEWGVEEGQ